MYLGEASRPPHCITWEEDSGKTKYNRPAWADLRRDALGSGSIFNQYSFSCNRAGKRLAVWKIKRSRAV